VPFGGVGGIQVSMFLFDHNGLGCRWFRVWGVRPDRDHHGSA